MRWFCGSNIISVFGVEEANILRAQKSISNLYDGTKEYN
jgi:hypothetical protein